MHNKPTGVSDLPVWVEARKLILPKTLIPSPVLPKNNIGHLSIKTESKLLCNTLYYFTNNRIAKKETRIGFNTDSNI
jgi:hypothetical protein